MDQFTNWWQESIGLSPGLQQDLLTSLGVVAVLWLLRRLVLNIVWRRVDDVRVRYRWQKTTSYIAVPIGILLIGWIWFEGVGPLATFLGLVSAGIAIALKDILVNLAGWVFILWRRPFELGDRIQIGEQAGDVIDIRIFQFSLLEIGNWVHADQSTGRIVHVPNGKVLTEATANFTRGFQYIWNELPVLLTFESNWEKAKTLLQQIAERHAAHLTDAAQRQVKEVSRRFLIFYQTLTPTVYTSVEDSGVLLTIRYLCAPRERRGTAQAIWEDVLRAFAQHADIDFAYPTQRFYDNRVEGKQAGPP
ncbi:MAG: mechanosensitive ion channel family protein [Gemmatimonadota bacterium]|nr:mechanosensitive ion channel family protein [Gemmatimonadota bacterium]MDH5198335.1 mechanosensitive ion channel family protein [Gemmatimonadota bacterium]